MTLREDQTMLQLTVDDNQRDRARRRAAEYRRLSQDRTSEMAGVERQGEDNHELARTLGWDVARTFTDNDTSATNGKPRPAYEEMLKGIQAGQFDAIVVWHPDRLYRRLADLERLINIVQEHNVEIRTRMAGEIDLNTPTGRMNARIIGAVATHEGELKAERQKLSITQKRKEGRPPGGRRMFGYTADGWSVVPHEVAAVHEGIEFLKAGGALTGLCRSLNDRGLLTTSGNPWQPTQLAHYLRNPRIAGYSTHHGKIVGKGQWPAIIDDETREVLLTLVRARPRDERTPRVALLAGMLVCGVCGHKLVTTGRTVKRKDKPNGYVRRYGCPTKSNNPAYSGCGRVSGDLDPIESIVTGYVKEFIARPEIRERLEELAAAADSGSLVAEADALRAHKVELQHALSTAGSAVASVVEAIQEADRKLAVVEEELSRLGTVRLPGPGEKWPADLHQRRAIIDRVLAKVYLDPDPRRGPGSKGGFVPSRVQRFEPAPGLEDLLTADPTAS